MKFSVISSGSSGNMTYVEFENGAFLIDAGIALVNAKCRIDLDFSKVKAIFCTHEHIDHTKFLRTVSKKLNIPIYINKKSFNKIIKPERELLKDECKIFFIEEDSHYNIFDIDVYTLKLSHDAGCCLGYIFKENSKQIAYITDTGFFPTSYLNIVSDVDGLIIEANHDISMLKESSRPPQLIRRILSPKGHMSNYICFQILKQISKNIKVIVLAHISRECNSLECINRDIITPLQEIYDGKICVASQETATDIIEL